MAMSLWSCTSCSKSFTRKGDLTRHQLLHTGIKPHVCETCGKGFAQFSGLKTHRNVHSKVKPFLCGIGTCWKAFGDPSSCSRHRKETHSREGAYKCIVADCGTRIKRRSSFVAHLRKHGFDPTSFDINVAFSQSRKGGPTPNRFAPTNVENKNDHQSQSRSMSPLLNDSPEYCTLTTGGASYFTDEWPGDHPLDCRRVNLLSANETLLPTVDQTVNVSTSIPHNLYPYPSKLDDPFYFDGIFPSAVTGYPLLTASPLHLPVFEPFVETGVDGSQSSSSTPSSTYSALY